MHYASRLSAVIMLLWTTFYSAIGIAADAISPSSVETMACARRCNAIGDGAADDTDAIQKALDAGPGTVYLPATPNCYLISRPLLIHSNQVFRLDQFAVIRLKPHSDCVMIANANPGQGNENIAVSGGIWDMNNIQQSLTEYQKTRRYTSESYDPARYLGVLMRFNNVKNLTIRDLSLKNPVTYGVHLGNLRQFTVENITFDYNMARKNMDGVHINGNSRFGRVSNLVGATNDDQLALNADDCGYFEMSRGPIENVSVDGISAENGYTAVRLLSAGSPIRRIKLSNIFGTYCYNIVSFTNHRAHPGAASTFDDISIEGVFCTRAMLGGDPGRKMELSWSPIWIDAPAVVGNLSIRDYHRTESLMATDDIYIAPGATVRCLNLSDVSLVNHSPQSIAFLNNAGMINMLNAVNASATSEDRGNARLIDNTGTIHNKNLLNNLAPKD